MNFGNKNWRWDNEPKTWKFEDESKTTLFVQSEGKSDYWVKTRHNFVNDNGNFFYQNISGNFEMSVKFKGNFESTLYDQAGLMIRESGTVWVKSGIEYYNEKLNASAVITTGYSDWNLVPLDKNYTLDMKKEGNWFIIKMKRINEAVEIEYSINDGKTFILMRMGYLTDTKKPIKAGIMVASPGSSKGFATLFKDFKLVKKEFK